MSAVGVSLSRIDGAEKVAGQAVYAGDLRLPGMAYAKVLRSPVPHARIRHIDSSQGEGAAGCARSSDPRQFESCQQFLWRLRQRPTDHRQ